jgi:hypothetical protein
MWSTTLRLPAYDCAMRLAVCLSLPVATLPLSEICVSVTLTITLLLLSVGSFFRAPSICDFSWSVSDWPAAVEEDCATPPCALLLGLVLVLIPVLELWPAAVEG